MANISRVLLQERARRGRHVSCLACFQSQSDPHTRVANELQGWAIVDQVHQITVPTLIVNGRHDTAADWTLAPLFKNIPRVKWVQFESEGSSHTPMWENRERYIKIVDEFLD
jgi:pimeloyl-ACP methyl ester carboxylesterase